MSLKGRLKSGWTRVPAWISPSLSGSSSDRYYLNLNSNISALLYNPNIGSNSLDIHIVLYNNSNYVPEKLQTLILSVSNLIDHNNKENPISKYYIYQFTGGFNSLEYSRINFNFKYVKY